MTNRFLGYAVSAEVGTVLTRGTIAAALLGASLLGCSAADPIATGSASATPEDEPAPAETAATPTPLPPGAMTTIVDGEPVVTDASGTVLVPVTVTNDDGTMMEVLTNPSTGMTFAPAPTTPPASPSPASTPGVIVDDGEDQIIEDGEMPAVPSGGELVEGVVCASSEVSFEPIVPTVMLLMDRSTSMFAPNLPNGGSPTPVGAYADRWEALRAAVGLLEPYAGEVQFGAMTYTGFQPTAGNGMCPLLQGEGGTIALDNFATVQALLPASAAGIPEAKSETPTDAGIIAATNALLAVESDGPKYIVLVTDGLPETCGYFDRGVFCGADPTIAAVQAAYTQGIKTFVIGIGFDVSADGNEAIAGEYLLNGIAHAGQGLEVPPSANLDQFRPCLQGEAMLRGEMEPPEFYTGENWRLLAQATYGATGTTFTDQLYLLPGDNDLGAQLSQVVAGVRSCSFEMGENIVRAQAGRGAVQLTMVDGTTSDLVFGDPNGWALDATRDDLVVVSGTACTQVQAQDQVQAVKIEFPCEVRIPKAR